MSSLHERPKNVFLLALACPIEKRSGCPEEACGTDTVLRTEVESLLAFPQEHAEEVAEKESVSPEFVPHVFHCIVFAGSV